MRVAYATFDAIHRRGALELPSHRMAEFRAALGACWDELSKYEASVDKNVVLTGLMPRSLTDWIMLDEMSEVLPLLARRTGDLELAERFFRLSIVHSSEQGGRNGRLKLLPPRRPGSLFDGILEFLERGNWTCHEDREAQTITVPIKSRIGSWVGIAHAKEDAGLFLFDIP